jgi:hypothetical protein
MHIFITASILKMADADNQNHNLPPTGNNLNTNQRSQREPRAQHPAASSDRAQKIDRRDATNVTKITAPPPAMIIFEHYLQAVRESGQPVDLQALNIFARMSINACAKHQRDSLERERISLARDQVFLEISRLQPRPLATANGSITTSAPGQTRQPLRNQALPKDPQPSQFDMSNEEIDRIMALMPDVPASAGIQTPGTNALMAQRSATARARNDINYEYI